MKPEEAKEMWEWCGFTVRCPPEKDAYGRGLWNYPNGTWGDLELDLNNLFEYAVPKLQDKGIVIDLIAYEHKGYGCIATSVVDMVTLEVVRDDNPAEALGQVILQLIRRA